MYYESDSDPDSIFPSYTSGSTIAPADEFWEDESIFWETTRRDLLLNTTDLEEEILFFSGPASIESFSLADPDPDPSDSEDTTSSISDFSWTSDTMGKTDYKDIAELMETKSPGNTTPVTAPRTIQLLQFKKTLVSKSAPSQNVA